MHMPRSDDDRLSRGMLAAVAISLPIWALLAFFVWAVVVWIAG